MPNITIICTAHKENGKCNSIELYEILKEFKPEVIFEELTPIFHVHCYDFHFQDTLETNAIKMYLTSHKVKHIPVLNSELSKDFDLWLNIMTKQHNYQRLIDNFCSLEAENGFQFLNSKYWEEIIEKMEALEELVWKDNENMLQIYQKRNKAIDQYETGILQNIYNYSSKYQYTNALMLIGAAHRKSIIQQIENYARKENVKLNWKIYSV